MWTDLKVRINPDGTVEELSSIVPFKQPQLVQHESSQYEYLYPENKTAFKLNTPWIAKCNDNTKFMLMESHYSTNFFSECGT